MKFDFIYDEKVDSWCKKFGYYLYVDIFLSLSVGKFLSEKSIACDFDYNSITQEKIVELIKQSVKEDKDLIAPYVRETELPDNAII